MFYCAECEVYSESTIRQELEGSMECKRCGKEIFSHHEFEEIVAELLVKICDKLGIKDIY